MKSQRIFTWFRNGSEDAALTFLVLQQEVQSYGATLSRRSWKSGSGKVQRLEGHWIGTQSKTSSRSSLGKSHQFFHYWRTQYWTLRCKRLTMRCIQTQMTSMQSRFSRTPLEIDCTSTVYELVAALGKSTRWAKRRPKWACRIVSSGKRFQYFWSLLNGRISRSCTVLSPLIRSSH